MRVADLFVALGLLTCSLMGLAQSCPVAKSLPYLPVHDQDGLGTCSANVAALILQHNLGLPKSPSYIQMSITESAKAEHFFSVDVLGKERIFNWGAHICDVVKETSTHGFCDYDKMGFDFVGTLDNTGAQQELLVKVARFLEAKESDIRQMRIQLRDPASRTKAQRRFAYFFANSKTTCSLSFREFVSRRALARMKEYWDSILASQASAQEKATVTRLYPLTFLPSGEPRPSTLESYRDFLDANVNFDQQLFAAEDRFVSWWGNWNDVDTALIPQREGHFYLTDKQAYEPCSQPEAIQGLAQFFNAPTCQLSALEPLSPELQSQAETIVSTLKQLSTGGLDPQAGIVNILAPACAAQMQQRANQQSSNCLDLKITSVTSATTAKDTSVAEICAGRAVGLSICTGFFKATTPIDTKFCADDAPSVADHGFHAVTLIGYRQGPGGRRQFLIQNSWGNTCPFRKHVDGIPAALKDLVECESKSLTDSSSTGRFWVDEELLFNNTYKLSTYRP